ncbi:hypothetical protein E2562_020421 [Oryza meyeriana var. granulata]|uniref:Uncharacterized protein n=1 Tax=Oryza meyeriana var. granulata TaxID=110450 RepID=A0A6G1D794_9ORYZ|nr:hypothetical protein E2562_020421 [Oryza meyeriana var. granulata]
MVSRLREMCPCNLEEVVMDVSSRILLCIKARYPNVNLNMGTQLVVADTSFEDYNTNKDA